MNALQRQSIGTLRRQVRGLLPALQERILAQADAPRRIRVLNPSGLRATAADGFAPEH